MRQKIKTLIAIVIITGFALAFVFNFDRYLTLEALKENRAYLHEMVEQHYASSVALYILTYILLIAFSIPTGGILTVAGGFLFGVLPTTLYVCLGATTGASLAFLLTRYLVGDSIERQYPRYAKKINEEITRYGYSYMLMLRLVTFIPFFLVNILAGTTKIPFITFVWTTALGIIPATMAFAFAGQQLATINSIHDIFSIKLLAAFALLVILALTPMLIQRFKRRKIL